MKLTAEQAKATINHPSSEKEIKAVKEQESQLRVFTEDLDINDLEGESYWATLQRQMKARARKKYDRVFSFARYPLPTLEITDSILTDFYKVFDGKNRHFNIDGDRDLSQLKKWVNEQNLEKWIEANAKEVYKNKPNTFIVVDINEQGQPYLIIVDSTRLIDAKFKNKGGDLEYITFIHSQRTDDATKKIYTKYGVYDDTTYYVYEREDATDNFTEVLANTHTLGYCPAISFISTHTNKKNYFKRRVAFSKSLASLEDWTLFDIYRNYTDHYAPFPVTESPRQKCGNPDCNNGTIKHETVEDQSKPHIIKTYFEKCEICEANDGNHIFPGTHIGINVKADKDLKDGSGIFKMHFPDTANMDYIPKKLDGLELKIRQKTVGINLMQSVNQSMNEMQVAGSYSSQETVLLRTVQDLNRVYKWITTTVGNLIYINLQIRIDANFGSEFYLLTENDLQERFKNAKTIGLPQEEQMMIYEQLIDTKYNGNPHKIERQKLMAKLDPLPLYTNTEVISLKEKNIINNETLSLKINFISFVTRFESENVPITQFGLALEPQKRIEAIRKVLDIYNKEALDKIPPPTPVVVDKKVA